MKRIASCCSTSTLETICVYVFIKFHFGCDFFSGRSATVYRIWRALTEAFTDAHHTSLALHDRNEWDELAILASLRGVPRVAFVGKPHEPTRETSQK